MQTKEINYKGKRLVYRTVGDGPPVVLLHGFGENGFIWKHQFKIFPDNQLIVPDLPGSGDSEAIEDMSIEGMADAVKAIVDAEISMSQEADNDIDPLQSEPSQFSVPSPLEEGGGEVLIGHSMGGYITLAFAEKYSADLRGFGLFHSTAFADNEEKKELRRKGIRFIETHGAVEFLKTSIPNLYSSKTREEHPNVIEEHLEAVRNFSASSLVSYYKAMLERPDRTAILKESKVPVLFVMGRHDNAVPVKDGLLQCHLPQTAYIHVLQNSAHAGMVEEAAEADQILSQFVNDIQKTA